MSSLSDSIKGKITVGNNKYVNKHEKRATIIKGNKAENSCIISSITRDGIPQVFYNVPVIYDTTNDTLVSWFPKDGEEVRVVENNKNYSIVGPVIEYATAATEFDVYSAGANDASGKIQ